ncbi:hypothetical protein K435DRAFT_971554 [Dendrothele bispora CBS 962.96]|uniref:Uncharacterized protein n=1 Tax=Dendrothele bispora (strain CBS 962.96) TaxID=1314807 RepID=A0A4S8L549_DENBC|nr:hypothetical protein K435DRAFT_971554 [Dendrothele bispora CBS 962.96]
MWELYEKRLKDFGGSFDKHWLYLGSDGTNAMMNYFAAWVNEATVRYGGKVIDGPSKSAQEMGAIWSKARFSHKLPDTGSRIPGLQSGREVWQDAR